jgi:hypothetical protein
LEESEIRHLNYVRAIKIKGEPTPRAAARFPLAIYETPTLDAKVMLQAVNTKQLAADEPARVARLASPQSQCEHATFPSLPCVRDKDRDLSLSLFNIHTECTSGHLIRSLDFAHSRLLSTAAFRDKVLNYYTKHFKGPCDCRQILSLAHFSLEDKKLRSRGQNLIMITAAVMK